MSNNYIYHQNTHTNSEQNNNTISNTHNTNTISNENNSNKIIENNSNNINQNHNNYQSQDVYDYTCNNGHVIYMEEKEQNTRYNSTCARFRFQHIFHKYENVFRFVIPSCCTEVPVKNGKIVIGSSSLYGDSNHKINRSLCMYPRQILQPYDDSIPYNNIKCKHSMMNGNRFQKEIKTCLYYTEILLKNGLPRHLINPYVRYMDYLQQWKISSKSNNIQRQQKLKQKLEIFVSHQKLFDNITCTLLPDG